MESEALEVVVLSTDIALIVVLLRILKVVFSKLCLTFIIFLIAILQNKDLGHAITGLLEEFIVILAVHRAVGVVLAKGLPTTYQKFLFLLNILLLLIVKVPTHVGPCKSWILEGHFLQLTYNVRRVLKPAFLILP